MHLKPVPNVTLEVLTRVLRSVRIGDKATHWPSENLKPGESKGYNLGHLEKQCDVNVMIRVGGRVLFGTARYVCKAKSWTWPGRI